MSDPKDPLKRISFLQTFRPVLRTLFRPPRRGLALCIPLSVPAIAMLFGSTPAQTAWSRIAQSAAWTPDYTWGPHFGKGGSRLVDDGLGKLYLSLGDSLYVAENGGSTWKTAPIKTTFHAVNALPIAASPNGMVRWGNWSSQDRGATWADKGAGGFGFPIEYAILGSGAVLAGGSYDGISLTVDSGRTWKAVHQGKTFGNVADFSVSRNGWCFAAPEVDEVLASRDEGKTWFELRSRLKSGSAALKPQSLSGMILATENRAYEQILWSVERNRTGKPTLSEFSLLSTDSIGLIKQHAVAGFPDSAISALGIAYDGGTRSTLFLGTWGQGVFVSQDRGETWKPRNEGLHNLHVEALCLPRVNVQDTVLALTPDGLYRISAFPAGSGLAHMATQSGQAADHGNTIRKIRNGFLFKSSQGPLCRPDGRTQALPLPKP